ncbi:MAG: ArnT family glycosyltransferase [Chitinophagaceae bacterium]
MNALTANKIVIGKTNKMVFLTLLSLVLFFISIEEGMFWDNVLFASKMGNHIYKNGLFNWTIPDSFDPGHPPFLAFIQALGWKLFGKSLWVSHLVMLPFLFGLLLQLWRFVSFFSDKVIYQRLAFCLLIVDPTFMAQLVLINPEVIQLFFFFLGLNAIFYKQNIFKALSLAFLGIVTYRGMMLFAGLALFDFLLHTIIEKRSLISFFSRKTILIYVIAATPAFVYIIWRLTTKGWLQTHPQSPWAHLWHFVTLKEFGRNIIVLTQRFADFGRCFVFLLLAFFLFWQRKWLQQKSVKTLLLLAICGTFFIIVVSIFSTNEMGHRYFIVAYLASILLAFEIIKQHPYFKQFYGFLLVALLTGNLWIYPTDFAQGWDASLAHMPYFSLREKAIQYLDEKNIPIEQVATFFPNESTIDDVSLNGDQRSFTAFTDTSKYVFVSTVFNLSDKELSTIHVSFDTIQSFQKNRISVTILKHK